VCFVFFVVKKNFVTFVTCCEATFVVDD